MEISTTSFDDGSPIPEEYAFCAISDSPDEHATMSENRNPHIAWSGIPEDAKSLVLICHDPDVPSEGDDVNQEGKTVPADLPRVDFFHWVLVDIDPQAGEIAEGAFSDGVTPHGKEGPEGPFGTRRGLNNYTQWFEGDEEMGGQYFGYDGPCPPWNDERLHHYHFTLYAIDSEKCPVDGVFDGEDVLKAIGDHILDSATITGTYTLNPDVKG